MPRTGEEWARWRKGYEEASESLVSSGEDVILLPTGKIFREAQIGPLRVAVERCGLTWDEEAAKGILTPIWWRAGLFGGNDGQSD